MIKCLWIFLLILILFSVSISRQCFAQSNTPVIHSLSIATGLKWPCDGIWHTQPVKIPHGIKIYGGFTTVGTVSTWMDWEIWTPTDLLMHIPKVESIQSWDLNQTPPLFRWFYPAYFTSYNDEMRIGGWCNPDGQWQTDPTTGKATTIPVEWMMGGAIIYYGN